MTNELRKLERERVNLLFAVATSIGMFVYYELGRRLRVRDERDDVRKTYVDGKIALLDEANLGNKERSAARDRMWQTIIAVGGLLLTAATIYSLLR